MGIGAPDAAVSAGPALALPTVADTALDLDLAPLDAEARPLRDWLTMFPLLPVVLDPYTNESAWLLETARRVLENFRGADCRTCWIVTADADDARRFLGPYADELLTFADPGARVVRSLGVTHTPAILLVRQDGAVTAKAEGWDPDAWRDVTESVVGLTHWSRPTLPGAGDPAPYSGTPVG